jgi:hypothetical protein
MVFPYINILAIANSPDMSSFERLETTYYTLQSKGGAFFWTGI